jgi:hypothetical protein
VDHENHDEFIGQVAKEWGRPGVEASCRRRQCGCARERQSRASALLFRRHRRLGVWTFGVLASRPPRQEQKLEVTQSKSKKFEENKKTKTSRFDRFSRGHAQKLNPG